MVSTKTEAVVSKNGTNPVDASQDEYERKGREWLKRIVEQARAEMRRIMPPR